MVALLVAWWPGGLVHIATQYMNESDAFVTILVDVLWIAATVIALMNASGSSEGRWNVIAAAVLAFGNPAMRHHASNLCSNALDCC